MSTRNFGLTEGIESVPLYTAFYLKRGAIGRLFLAGECADVLVATAHVDSNDAYRLRA